ncbi:hypothetical protein D1BOALGB6SA_8505 [Olavius sp. associated proteobacterium Delta 1]|nr:hypothetical protein D1BOALGB6SA_8505 [Olavius sp. associated proteobacterium Delta 1]
MEIIEKGHTISINAGKRFPFKKILADAGIAVVFIWGVFYVLVIFLSNDAGELLPYFIAISLFLIIPLAAGVLIRQSLHYGEILFDGEKRHLSLKSLWRKQQVSFDDIKEFQVDKYRIKTGLFLYRLEAVPFSGKPLRLIQDVPDKQSLRSFGRKIEKLVNKPLSIK